MEDEKAHSFYLTYLALFLLSWVLAGIGAAFSKYNPVSWLMFAITNPLISPGSSSAVSADAGKMFFNLLWPLTLVPMHLVTVQGMKWRLWKFLLLCFCFNLLLAYGIRHVDLGF